MMSADWLKKGYDVTKAVDIGELVFADWLQDSKFNAKF